MIVIRMRFPPYMCTYINGHLLTIINIDRHVLVFKHTKYKINVSGFSPSKIV